MHLAPCCDVCYMLMRRRAYNHVIRKIKKGEIVPQPCSHCGSEVRPHAHHEDYAKPDDIMWLCRICHTTLHSQRRQMVKNVKQLKLLVDRAGRKLVAEAIGMPYQTMSHKLNRFSPIRDDEIAKIKEAATRLAQTDSDK